jgi:hypothetical protein
MGLAGIVSSLASEHVSMWRIVHQRGEGMKFSLAVSLAGMLFSIGSSFAAGPEDVDFVIAASLPPAVSEALRGNPKTANYKISTRINPYYVQGDFNGDGKVDTALLIEEKASGKAGIAFVLGKRKIAIVGAGKATGNGGDSFDWMDAWYVYEQGKVQMGADENAPPTLKGDALLAMKAESASGLIYWNGSTFAWYQQGD